MRFFCLGKPLPLINLGYAHRFFDIPSVIMTPLFGKLPVNQRVMRNAFNESEELILCRNIYDAIELRFTRVCLSNKVDYRFRKLAVAKGYPLADFAIYEIEADKHFYESFTRMEDYSLDALYEILSPDCYWQMIINGTKILPDISIYQDKKDIINPRLIECHYLPLPLPEVSNEGEENDSEYSSRIF